jgi:hypothetical protein
MSQEGVEIVRRYLERWLPKAPESSRRGRRRSPDSGVRRRLLPGWQVPVGEAMPRARGNCGDGHLAVLSSLESVFHAVRGPSQGERNRMRRPQLP